MPGRHRRFPYTPSTRDTRRPAAPIRHDPRMLSTLLAWLGSVLGERGSGSSGRANGYPDDSDSSFSPFDDSRTVMYQGNMGRGTIKANRAAIDAFHKRGFFRPTKWQRIPGTGPSGRRRRY